MPLSVLRYILQVVAYSTAIGVLAFLYFIAKAWFAAKAEIKQVPREPMLVCEIHGMFPAKSALEQTIPGVTSGKVELCPFCMHDRVSKKKVPVS